MRINRTIKAIRTSGCHDIRSANRHGLLLILVKTVSIISGTETSDQAKPPTLKVLFILPWIPRAAAILNYVNSSGAEVLEGVVWLK